MRINFSPKQWLVAGLGIVFLVYCLFQGRYLILGPGVTILSHENGAVVDESVITLTGRARNAAWLSLNDRQIFTDENGYWEEKLIVSVGTSIMTVGVRDRFGRDKAKIIKIIFNG